MKKPGDRVGALIGGDNDKKELSFLGYGVYEGDETPSPEEGVIFFGMPMTHNNPKLRLDDGQVVYGCECWWGTEEQTKKQLEGVLAKGWTIKTVPISEYRAEAKRLMEEGARLEKEIKNGSDE